MFLNSQSHMEPLSINDRQLSEQGPVSRTLENEEGGSRCLGQVPSWARQHFQALFSRKNQVLNNSIRGEGWGANYRLAQKALALGTWGEKSGQAPSK